MYIVVGLGNPGEEYSLTRHNAGRMAAEFVALKVSGVKVVTPDTFMNHSGRAVAKAMAGKKSFDKLIVIYDDLDLSIGTMKISFNRSSGGHRGLESIIHALKTEAFIRIRIGISPKTPSGKLKKPKGEAAVEKHILTEFKKPEMEALKKVFKTVVTVVETIKDRGLQPAMTEFNS
ncbi:MAG: aminoacyl-tRNA hydrolase [Candidatus Zambryskibacteria bacterium]|nr:aminoacyl-tRNA hydrolase [Candidatus Zambryskibacteria bacterium]